MATNTFNAVSIPVGSQTLGPVNVPNGLTYVLLKFSNWAQAGRTLSCFVESSTDGLSWVALASMNATPGGAGRVNPRAPTGECSFGFGLPEGVGRQLRATAIVAGGTVVTDITIITS